MRRPFALLAALAAPELACCARCAGVGSLRSLRRSWLAALAAPELVARYSSQQAISRKSRRGVR